MNVKKFAAYFKICQNFPGNRNTDFLISWSSPTLRNEARWVFAAELPVTGERFSRAEPRGSFPRGNVPLVCWGGALSGAVCVQRLAVQQIRAARQKHQTPASTTKAAAGKSQRLVSLRTGDLFKQPVGFPRRKLFPELWEVANFKNFKCVTFPWV